MKKLEFYKDTDGGFRWRVTETQNGKIVGGSTQGFSSKQGAKENYEMNREFPALEESDDVVNLAPPLTEEQLKINAHFQREMSELFSLPTGESGSFHSTLIEENIRLLKNSNQQFTAAATEMERESISAKAEQLRRDTSEVLIASENSHLH